MKKYTLQKKISKTFIALFICIFLVVIILISAISGKVYWSKTYELCEQLVSLNLDLLNNQIVEMQKTLEIVAENDVVKEAVDYYNEKTEKDYGVELQFQRKLNDVFQLFDKDTKVNGAYIIDKEGNYISFYKQSLKLHYNMLNEEWYQRLIDDMYMNICYVSGYHDTNYLVTEADEQYVSMVMPIQCGESYEFRPDAFLVCDVDISTILDNSKHKDDMQFAILDSKGELYSDITLDLSGKEKNRVITSVKDNSTYIEILNRNFLDRKIVVSMQSQMYGWKVIGVKNLQEIKDLIRMLLLIFSITFAGVLILVSLLSNRVSRSLLLPMNNLIEECNQVAVGDYNIKFKEKKSEEISFLSDTIQKMVNSIVKLKDQVLLEEKELSKEKIRVLQHQINPHFLNNVLQTIKAMAVAGDTEKISKMTTLFGRILAYSVYEPYESVELKTELEYLQNYIEVQNMRFENNILYAIDCEDEAKTVQIPKLTLQPLVENSIEHGYKGKSKMFINISAEVEPDMVCVIISDNGEGIEKEELEILNKRLETGQVYKRKSSVGVVNVNERLKKMFGEKYGIQILSKNNRGTTVIMRIPKRKETFKYEGTLS